MAEGTEPAVEATLAAVPRDVISLRTDEALDLETSDALDLELARKELDAKLQTESSSQINDPQVESL